MKKLLAIAGGLLIGSGAYAEFEMPALSINSSIKFETADVSEGTRSMDQNFKPSVEVGLPLFGKSDLYVGVDSTLATNRKKGQSNEVSPYIGFSYDITDMFTLDLGYQFSRKTSVKDDNRGEKEKFEADAKKDGVVITDQMRKKLDGELPKANFHKIYVGVMADVLMRPSVYFEYDTTQKKANIEGAVGYTLDLVNFGAGGLGIDLGAKVGFSHAKDVDGIKRGMWDSLIKGQAIEKEKGKKVEWLDCKKNWFYAGANADLVYSLNENAKARAGVAFTFNNAKKDDYKNSMNRSKHNVWFSSAMEFSF
ncbi:MAG: hypothetical protein LW808_003020 [Verrucomicrobiota bacterium]|nr:MAG: hypothetical protein LW808_003020 [Verrucomicrobiota bacterium]